MLYFLLESLGGLVIILLLVVMIVLYLRMHQQLTKLRRDMAQLQAKLQQHTQSTTLSKSAHSTTDSESSLPLTPTNKAIDDDPRDAITATQLVKNTSTSASSKAIVDAPIMEPDERSLPIVTSLINSLKHWFLGGNLVVRVGVLVLLVGVVLLLRLLSEYIEISIQIKLAAIAVIGLGLAGLGLKLAPKRFAYGITLQGAGLAIAYLTTFFAYSVYEVIPSLPSFVMLGVLSAATIGLAVRQDAFPLALLALSGGFFAPLLTATDTSNLSALFSYYLLLNVAIAIIAHYRTWKVLNVLGVAVTFGLAYYWGVTENLTAVITMQRLSLVLLVALHLLLYLFVAIRYTQQIIAYNINSEAASSAIATSNPIRSLYLYPIDIGLLFSVPVLAFGLFAALLDDINHALTITSAILAAIYLGLGWLLIQRSQCYALITEGMLALGFGFLALVIPLAFDAQWVAMGWSIQGLALVWFGRRSLRAWLVLFGLLLQVVSVGVLFNNTDSQLFNLPTLALSISAISSLAAMFILRVNNSPSILTNINSSSIEINTNNIDDNTGKSTDDIANYASTLGVSSQASEQWLMSIDSQSAVFNIVWRSPIFIRLLTFIAVIWALYVLIIDFDQWFVSGQLAMTALIAMATSTSLILYYVVNHHRAWAEIRQFSHGLLILFYLVLLLQLPQKYEFDYQWTTFHWPLFIALLVSWLIVGQLWLKSWHKDYHLKGYDSASWLGTGIIIVAEAVHYGLPDSKGVITTLVPVALMLVGLWFTYRQNQHRSTQSEDATILLPLYWFNWQQALLDCAKVFVPLTLIWAVLSNWSFNGIVWGLPYFPVFNLYDLALIITVAYGLSTYYLHSQRAIQQHSISTADISTLTQNKSYQANINDSLLIILGLISFWIMSSILVRTLHAFIGTPLWDGSNGGAWGSEQVQTGLTILWTLIALVATIIASRHKQRLLWFTGIGLLGVVVLKLVLVDLSQTEAIWRVISFLVAGSLILLIGYLAPLPPANVEKNTEK